MKMLILLAQLAAADVPCTVPVPEGTGEWKQITAENVTFCVPATWRVRGTRASYAGGSIRWQHTANRVMIRSGSTSSPQNISGSSNANSSPVRTESVPEIIAGRQATVMRQMGVGRLATSVNFTQPPPFSISGEAAGEEHVTIQLAVYRTVRFKE
ncbi:MAG: hypothetical protein IT357_14560 [Gemmatimonadaceae bacterium]|nr:hypothetical protein [Gemmatimonadaceae bacterium]